MNKTDKIPVHVGLTFLWAREIMIRFGIKQKGRIGSMWWEGMWSVVEISSQMVEELHLLEKVALREVREQTLPGQ